MTNAQHMLWMLDEYEAIHGKKFPGMITGKPVGMGGSLGRAEATGFGVIFTVREALKEMGSQAGEYYRECTGFRQCFAQFAIRLYNQLGGKVIAVAFWDQKDQIARTIKKADGVNLDELLGITDRFGGIDKEKAADLGYEILDGEAWIEQEVDILIPAAMENQITAENVRQDFQEGKADCRRCQRPDHSRSRQGHRGTRHCDAARPDGERRRCYL